MEAETEPATLANLFLPQIEDLILERRFSCCSVDSVPTALQIDPGLVSSHYRRDMKTEWPRERAFGSGNALPNHSDLSNARQLS